MIKYSYTYSKIVKEFWVDELWNVWADVNNYTTWVQGIDYAKMEGNFTTGNHICYKPTNAREFKMKLISVIANTEFTECVDFHLAKMYVTHQLLAVNDKVEIRLHHRWTGLLAGLWWKIIGAKIAHDEEKHTKSLLERVLYLRSAKNV